MNYIQVDSHNSQYRHVLCNVSLMPTISAPYFEPGATILSVGDTPQLLICKPVSGMWTCTEIASSDTWCGEYWVVFLTMSSCILLNLQAPALGEPLAGRLITVNNHTELGGWFI